MANTRSLANDKFLARALSSQQSLALIFNALDCGAALALTRSEAAVRKHELCWTCDGYCLRGHLSEAGSTGLAALAPHCEVPSRVAELCRGRLNPKR
jgi:hypothetical protein